MRGIRWNRNNRKIMAAKYITSIFILLLLYFHYGNAIVEDDRNYIEQILATLDVGPAEEKAQQWLLSQRGSNWGWGSDSDTANAIMALQLSQSNWANERLKYELSLKQMELYYALDMAGNRLTPGRVAQYIDAFLSVCKDPRYFYGNDLVSKLQEMEAGYMFEVGYRALGLCNAGVPLSSELVKKLEEILNTDSSPDTKAINLMALSCANKQGRSDDDKLKSYINQLGETQGTDGSFGNIWSTAIVVQSLLPFSDNKYTWNATSALTNILNSQDPEGSFSNQLGSFFVLPILNAKNLGDVNKTKCPAIELQTAIPVTSLTTKSSFPDINVIYSIWIENPVKDSYSIKLQVANLTTMYSLMVKAQELDERFRFTGSANSNGHDYFVTSIGELEQNPDSKSYWLYGILENQEDTDIKYADTSVDKFLLTQNEEHVVFWYKQIDF